MNVERIKKRRMEGGAEVDDFDEPLETINEQKTVIAKLHTPSSLYHQFRELLCRNSRTDDAVDGANN